MKRFYRFLINTLPRPMLIRLSYIFKYFSRIFYKGNNVECPVCERSFRKFLSYGSETAARDGVLCPYDLTLERHRLMWLYLTKKSDFFTSPKKVMHIAPEQCFHKKFQKQENLDYTTGDLMSPIADLHFDLHKIPLEDNQYDVVFCNHVMEHVEDDRQCMSEIFRIMKPGGWGIMQVPQDLNAATTYEDPTITDPKEREKHFWQYDHVRLYGMDYPDRLKSVGFEIEVYDYRIEFSKEQSDRYRLHENEMLYVVRKPLN